MRRKSKQAFETLVEIAIDAVEHRVKLCSSGLLHDRVLKSQDELQLLESAAGWNVRMRCSNASRSHALC